MAVRKLKDDKGKEYDVEIPDDDGDGGDGDDPDTIYLDEEDIEWLRKKRKEEAEAERLRSSSGTGGTPPKASGKVVKIRAKQSTSAADSSSGKQPTTRKRTLRLA